MQYQYFTCHLHTHDVDSTGKDVVKNKDGKNFEDIQAYFYEADFDPNNIEQSLYNAFKKEMGVTEKDWVTVFLIIMFYYILFVFSQSHSTFRSVLFYYFQKAPTNNLAFDISFGNRIGHSLILARASIMYV